MNKSTQNKSPPGKLTQSPAWKALQAHQAEIANVHMREVFVQEPERAMKFALEAGALLLDYSKHRVTCTTLALLADLARQAVAFASNADPDDLARTLSAQPVGGGAIAGLDASTNALLARPRSWRN